MRQTKKVEGTKIAQAAKDLNVTSVTVRRYISEFNIQTATDKNGIKVLPDKAMDELKEVRRLKEDGLTNPQVLEALEDQRSKPAKKTRAKKEEKVEKEEKEEKPRGRRTKEKDTEKSKDKDKDKEKSKDKDKEKSKEKSKARTKSESTRSTSRRGKKSAVDEESEEAPAASKGRRRGRKAEEEKEEELEEEEVEENESDEPEASEGRLKHSLTCQTCGKTFEHLNPRLRDCLDCYRSKRKERRRGGGDRHKNVIQHPLAQQVVNKMANQQQQTRETSERPRQNREPAPQSQKSLPHAQSVTQPIIGGLKTKVRSYRKAIEETRHITSSLKRRLERPDLPEGDRRWLEQIYAYQLILHQGWRHLSEYRSNTQQQAKKDD